jgi:hypothetical protein
MSQATCGRASRVGQALVFGLLVSTSLLLRAQSQEAEPADAPLATPATKSPPQLPWEATRPRAAEPVLRPPTSPREILERYEIGPSQLEGFFSGEPLGPGEEDVLAKILFRFPRLGREFFETWRIKDVSWDQLAAAPGEYRAQQFSLRGTVTTVSEHRLLPELAELMEFDHYYRVRIALADSRFRAVVCTRHIPAAWKVGKTLNEPAAVDALFLKVGGSTETELKPDLYFAAGRVAWFPDRLQPESGIGPSQLALAGAGFDLGLFDDLRQANGKGLGDADREAFYQLLSAVERLPSSKWKVGQAPLDVVPLLQEPQNEQLRQLPVQGIARRITKVAVGDTDVQRRFGIDHYFEIDLFLPLGDTTLRFGKDPTGEQNPVYANSFPATLIVRQLPPGLEPGDKQYEHVAANAVFFKLWTYRSSYTQQFGGLQPAPLFIANAVESVEVTSSAHVASGVLVGAAFALGFVMIGVVYWWFRGSDWQHARRTRKERSGNGTRPDFSQLN